MKAILNVWKMLLLREISFSDHNFEINTLNAEYIPYLDKKYDPTNDKCLICYNGLFYKQENMKHEDEILKYYGINMIDFNKDNWVNTLHTFINEGKFEFVRNSIDEFNFFIGNYIVQFSFNNYFDKVKNKDLLFISFYKKLEFDPDLKYLLDCNKVESVYNHLESSFKGYYDFIVGKFGKELNQI